MQNPNVLSCPNCGSDLTEALAKQLREDIGNEFRQKFIDSKKALEDQLNDQRTALERDLEVQRRSNDELKRQAADEARKREEDFQLRLQQQQQAVQQEAEAKAREKLDTEMQSLRAHVDEQQLRLKEQATKEIELLRKTRELEEQKEMMQLAVERQLNEERQRLRLQIEGQFTEQLRLREAEKDKKIDDMQKLIDDLQRKSQQGSQQTQGEVLEMELEQTLRASFLFDDVKPVPKGVRGADIIHHVYENAQDCGVILWESKRTKGWDKKWVPKLKEDLRELRASVAVIVTTVLPENVDSFANIDGVWVCSVAFAIPLAAVLRDGLIEVAKQRRAAEGKNEKMDVLYHYLTGQDFANHMQSMMEVFINMRKELDDEKRAYERIWAKREKQIERTQRSAIRIRGDLEGIVGNALPAMTQLELPAASEDEE